MINSLYSAYEAGLCYYASASSSMYPHNSSPMVYKTYILKGLFSFFEGSKYIEYQSERVVINQGLAVKDVCLVDNINGANHYKEDVPIYERIASVKDSECCHLEGDNLCLISTQWGESNIFHLLFDSIAKLSIVSEIIDINKVVVLVPSNNGRLKEFLNIFNIRYQEFPSNKFCCANVLIPSMPSALGVVPFNVVKWFEALGNSIVGDKNLPEYFFIGRKSPSKRLILNQDDLLTTLRGFADFKLVYLEDYSMENQIKLFKNAKCVVGPHGAGFSWGVFNTSAKYFEIFSPFYKNFCFQSFLDDASGRYGYFDSSQYDCLSHQEDHSIPIDSFTLQFSNFINCSNK